MNLKGPLRRADDPKHPHRMRRGMYVLPSIFTAGNIAAGYYAISQAIQGSVNAPFHFDNAAKAIGFAVVFDGLDGSIARLTNTASDFGRELDSLADVITFGVAPAILAWLWGCHQIPDAWQPDMRRKLIQIGAMVTFLFLIAGASRLARFNISKNPQPKNPGRPGRKYFVGMPIPAGAAMVAATVHFGDGSPVELWWQAVLWLVFVLLISYMMVSTWRFWSLKGIDFRSRQPFWLFIPICVAILLVWFFSEYFLFSIALLYLASGMLARFAYALKRRPPNPPTYQPESRVDMA